MDNYILRSQMKRILHDELLTKIEGIISDICYEETLVCNDRIAHQIENGIFISAAALQLHKYTQNDIIRILVVEHQNKYSELFIYSFDFNQIRETSDMGKACEYGKERVISIQCNDDFFKNWEHFFESYHTYIPFMIEIVCERNELLLSNLKTDVSVCLYIYKTNNEFKLKLKSQKYKLINFLQHYRRIMQEILIKKQCSEIKMLDKNEIEMQLITWNKTDMDFPQNKCLHHLFEDNVIKLPDAQAVIFEKNIETYDSLNKKANQLARYIKSKYNKDSIVALYIEKNIEMVIGILAILKLGYAYLPIDSRYPFERIQYMLQDSQAELVLTQSKLKSNIEMASNLNLIVLDEEWECIEKYDSFNLNCSVSPLDTAYVIYTSGSTGNPKGVVLNHRGRVNNFSDFNRRFQIGSDDKILAVSSLSFDMCAYDVLGTLMAGGTIVLPNENMSTRAFHWLSLIDELKVTIWHSVPIMLEMLCISKANRWNKSLESIRLVLLGGDWISTKLPDRFRQYNRDAILISLGGATEASMDSIIYKIEDVPESWVSIPYGRPMYNQRAYILSDKLELLPQGAIGELYIGGIGVADGYYNREELTNERFIDFECGYVKDRIYKTGDLVRYLEDGCIQLIGRNDFQVKIDGVRIELGEIEKKLSQHPNVEKAVCMAVNISKVRKKLVAAVQLRDKAEGEAYWSTVLRSHLKRSFTDKFIPEYYIILEEFPVTPNGKIDRNYLMNKAVEKLKEYINE